MALRLVGDPQWALGSIIASLRRMRPVPSGAPAFQDAAQALLMADGWSVRREVYVDDRGDGYRGRVDLVAQANGLTVGIELDNWSPRAKSLHKLRCMKADARLVVLRVPFEPQVIEHELGDVTVFGLEVST